MPGETDHSMGKRKDPCCEYCDTDSTVRVKKGRWTAAEDSQLRSCIEQHNHLNWMAVPNWAAVPKQAGLNRCRKSCRLRWLNYLSPDIRRGDFTAVEEQTIINLHKELGSQWAKIASNLPGRTDNEIKNVWKARLEKKVMKPAGAKKVGSNGSKTEYSASPSCISSNFTGSDQNIERALSYQEFQEIEIMEPYELLAPEVIIKNATDSIFYEPNQEVTQDFHPSQIQDFVPFESLEFDLQTFSVTNQEAFPADEGEIEMSVGSDVDYWEQMDSQQHFQAQNSAFRSQELNNEIQGQVQNGEIQGQNQEVTQDFHPSQIQDFVPFESLELDLPNFGVKNQEAFPTDEGEIEMLVGSDVDYWELMESLQHFQEQNNVIQSQEQNEEQNHEIHGQNQEVTQDFHPSQIQDFVPLESLEFDLPNNFGVKNQEAFPTNEEEIEMLVGSDVNYWELMDSLHHFQEQNCVLWSQEKNDEADGENANLLNKKDKKIQFEPNKGNDDLAWYKSMPGSPGNPFSF